jgi:hypothetical protein
MKSKKSSKLMSGQEFKKVLEMMEKEPLLQANILGGEPSLHPDAIEFSRQINGTGTQVGFSTNGFWNKEFRKKFESVDFPLEIELTYLGKNNYEQEKVDLIYSTISQLKGHKVSLGIILCSPNDDYAEHIEICKENQFSLRWALLEPIQKTGLTLGYSGQDQIKSMGMLASRMIKEANSEGISTWADLTVPKCAIENIDLFSGKLNDIQFKCPPFFDISTDLFIWRCLPLAPQITPKLTEFRGLREAYEFVNKIKEVHQYQGVFNECMECEYLNSVCSGGPAIAKRIKNGV